jgi:hypothetical protein
VCTWWWKGKKEKREKERKKSHVAIKSEKVYNNAVG